MAGDKIIAGEVGIKVRPLLDGFRDDVEREVKKLRNVKLRVVPDGLKQFRAQVQSELRKMDPVKVKVVPDTDGFRERLRAQLSGLDSVDIDVHADTDEAKRRIEEASQDTEATITYEADVDANGLQAKARALAVLASRFKIWYRTGIDPSGALKDAAFTRNAIQNLLSQNAWKFDSKVLSWRRILDVSGLAEMGPDIRKEFSGINRGLLRSLSNTEAGFKRFGSATGAQFRRVSSGAKRMVSDVRSYFASIPKAFGEAASAGFGMVDFRNPVSNKFTSGVDLARRTVDGLRRSLLAATAPAYGLASSMDDLGRAMKSIGKAPVGAFGTLASGAKSATKAIGKGLVGSVGRLGASFAKNIRVMPMFLHTLRSFGSWASFVGGVMGVFAGSALAVNAVVVGLGAVMGYLVDGVKQLSGAFVALPGAIGGVAIAGATLFTAFRGMGGAMSAAVDTSADLEEAISDLSPSAQRFARSLRKITPAWSDVRRRVQERMFQNLGQDLEEVSEKQLPSISKGMIRVATASSLVAREFAKFAKAEETTVALQKGFRSTASIMTTLGRSTKPFLIAMQEIGVIGLDVLDRRIRGLTSSMRSFEEWATSPEGKKKVRDWINDGLDGFGQLGRTVNNVYRSLQQVGRAFGVSFSGNALQSFEDFTAKFREWLGDASDAESRISRFAEGVKNFTDPWVETFKTAWDELQPAFAELMPFLSQVSEEFTSQLQSMLEWLGPKLEGVFKWISDNKDVFAPLVAGLLSLRVALGAFKLGRLLLSPFISAFATAGGLAAKVGGKAKKGAKDVEQASQRTVVASGDMIDAVDGKDKKSKGKGKKGFFGRFKKDAADAADATTKSATKIDKSLDKTAKSSKGKFGKIGKGFKSAGKGLSTGMKGVGKAAKGFGGVAKGAGRAFSLVARGALRFVPILGQVLLVVDLVILAFKNWDKISEWAGKAFDWVKEKVSQFVDWVQDKAAELGPKIAEWFGNVWEGAKEKWSAFWDAVGNWLSDKWNGIKETASKVWNSIGEWIGNAWQGVKDKWSEFWSGVGEWLSEKWTAIKDKATEAWEETKQTVAEVWDSITESWQEAWDDAKQFLIDKWNAIKEGASLVWDEIKNKLLMVWYGVSELWSMVWSGIGNTLSGIWEGLRSKAASVFESVSNAVSNAWNKVTEVTSSAWNSAKEAVSGAVSTIQDKVSSGFSAVTGAVTSAGSAIQSTVSSAWERAVSAFRSGVDRAVAVARGLPQKVKGALGNVGSILVASGKALIRGFINGMKSMIGAAASAAKGIVDKIRGFFPFSPAKEGPFSGRGYTTFSGQALVRDFAKGISGAAKDPVAAVSRMMTDVQSGFESFHRNQILQPALEANAKKVAEWRKKVAEDEEKSAEKIAEIRKSDADSAEKEKRIAEERSRLAEDLRKSREEMEKSLEAPDYSKINRSFQSFYIDGAKQMLSNGLKSAVTDNMAAIKHGVQEAAKVLVHQFGVAGAAPLLNLDVNAPHLEDAINQVIEDSKFAEVPIEFAVANLNQLKSDLGLGDGVVGRALDQAMSFNVNNSDANRFRRDGNKTEVHYHVQDMNEAIRLEQLRERKQMMKVR
ncbi:hypothetical protein [Corynebacterium pseudodiphtheriticum]|uniref:hypothetical protein n=1 Tax=Corynebacterium pseudodiphtheriticum TaxID=37637 RepID=UPI0020BE4F95|nr:hypothetical protein [Corynebacterium pseudodiphtheriticum]UQV56388.1 hypothetical protein L9H27_01055 [Corynebacterium pseudodiphtheriticum]